MTDTDNTNAIVKMFIRAEELGITIEKYREAYMDGMRQARAWVDEHFDGQERAALETAKGAEC